MISGYDESMLGPLMTLYYGFSDFHNFGYWRPETRTQSEASENLMEELLAFIPEKNGNILDVACGLGASTRHLLRYYAPEDIVATNISEVQLERGRQNAPGCKFLLMDATELEFPDASFDNIICVEAAFHFDTRDRFLREAHRVLKPGGRLVHSDILMDLLPKGTEERTHMPNVNHLENPEELRQRILAAGFARAEVVDATEVCWQPFLTAFRKHSASLRKWPKKGAAEARHRPRIVTFFNPGYFARFVRYYVLASSQKAEAASA
jgi:SAM-dependent methyltransferase